MTSTPFVFKNSLAILIIIGYSIVDSTCEAKQISTNPGSARFYNVGGIRFSCPRGFKRSDKLSNSEVSYLWHNKGEIGLVVKKVDSTLDEMDVRNMGSDVLQKYLSNKAAFDWKKLESDEKISKFELQTGRLLGFDGKSLALFQFRLIDAQGQKTLVSYFCYPRPRADDKEQFDKGYGYSCACDYAQAHIIASITGESYDSIMPLSGIPAPK